MSELTKKVSYLKGFADGLDISPKSSEGKIIEKILEVLDEMAVKLDEIEERAARNERELEALSESVDVLADDMFGGADDDIDDDDYDDFGDLFNDGDDDDDDEGDVFEIQCPACGEDVMVDFDMLEDGEDIICPNCHEEIELKFSFDDEDDDLSGGGAPELP